MSNTSRLSGEFNRGYTKAIQDIIEIFKYMNYDLRVHKIRMNYTWVEKILKCCLENRSCIRDDRDGFFRSEKSDSGARDVVKWYECSE